jgi:putative SOS response-associated peptidase YedK
MIGGGLAGRGARDTTIPLALLRSYPAERMRAYPVSRRVGSPRNDDPGLIEPADH